MLEPTGEEVGTGQLVGLVQIAELWPAAAVAAHSSVHLSFLVVLFCCLHPSPNHRTATADIGTGGADPLQV